MANVVPKTKAELEASGWEFSQESSQYNMYAWGGAITPDSEIGELIFPTLFFASAVGLYPNCGNVYIPVGTWLIVYDNGVWDKQELPIESAADAVGRATSTLRLMLETDFSNLTLTSGYTYFHIQPITQEIGSEINFVFPDSFWAQHEPQNVPFDGVTIRLIIQAGVSNITLNGNAFSSYGSGHYTVGVDLKNLTVGKTYNVTLLPFTVVGESLVVLPMISEYL